MPEKKIKRSEFATYLNIGTTETPSWARMGKGITSQVITYNPATTSETYIHEDNATTNLDSYAPTIATPQTAYAGEAVFDYVDAIRKTRATGDGAKGEVLLVYFYDKDSSNKYYAEKNDVVIAIDDFGGDGGASVVVNYTINLNGDPVIGKATLGTGGTVTFEAETPSI